MREYIEESIPMLKAIWPYCFAVMCIFILLKFLCIYVPRLLRFIKYRTFGHRVELQVVSLRWGPSGYILRCASEGGMYFKIYTNKRFELIKHLQPGRWLHASVVGKKGLLEK